MKNLTLFFLFIGLGNIQIANAQNCRTIILSDDFSSSANWQSQGNGDVNISNGKCNFHNVYCHSYNRVYRDLGTTLSNNYWKAECDFSILNANPSGNGTNEVIMALSAGTLDFVAYDASGSYAFTNQDGIAVLINSVSAIDNNTNNWYFSIGGKKGTVLSNSGTTPQIYANSSISNYYIRLERTATGMTQLSVFSDPAFTTHLPGSPITFAIDPTITGLNTVQHGTSVVGWTTRFINATVDNDLICQNSNEGITNIEKDNQILIYPVPAINNITIKNPNTTIQNYIVSIMNIQRQEIFCEKINFTTTHSIDVTGLSNGIYILSMQNGKENYVNKIIIQK